jgi:hypothetical protein
MAPNGRYGLPEVLVRRMVLASAARNPCGGRAEKQNQKVYSGRRPVRLDREAAAAGIISGVPPVVAR